MAQEKFENISNEWVGLSDLITVEADKLYFIQNRGPDKLLALESSTEPEETDEGILVEPYVVLEYKAGVDNLYLRAFDKSLSINISSEG